MRGPAIYTGLLRLLVALLLLLLAVTRARALPQEQERETLGSLTSVGEVYVNDSPAPAEITIFSGDRGRRWGKWSTSINIKGKGPPKAPSGRQTLLAGQEEIYVVVGAGGGRVDSNKRTKGVEAAVG